MVDPFEVSSFERGVVRVFTTDLDAEGNSAITPGNVHRLLGSGLDLDPTRIEVFPSTVIQEMGLSAYLAEGYGIPVIDLKGTEAKLDSIKGLVILIASSAFKQQEVKLAPTDGIRFVGAFQEQGMAPPKRMETPASTEGHLSPSGLTPENDAGSRSFWPTALIVLLAVTLLFFVLAV